jgi:hypothetical protein
VIKIEFMLKEAGVHCGIFSRRLFEFLRMGSGRAKKTPERMADGQGG